MKPLSSTSTNNGIWAGLPGGDDIAILSQARTAIKQGHPLKGRDRALAAAAFKKAQPLVLPELNKSSQSASAFIVDGQVYARVAPDGIAGQMESQAKYYKGGKIIH